MKAKKALKRSDQKKIAGLAKQLAPNTTSLFQLSRKVAEQTGCSTRQAYYAIKKEAPELAEKKLRKPEKREVSKQEILDLAEAMKEEMRGKGLKKTAEAIGKLTGKSPHTVIQILYKEADEETLNTLRAGRRPKITKKEKEQIIKQLEKKIIKEPPKTEYELNILVMDLSKKKGVSVRLAKEMLGKAIDRLLKKKA